MVSCWSWKAHHLSSKKYGTRRVSAPRCARIWRQASRSSRRRKRWPRSPDGIGGRSIRSAWTRNETHPRNLFELRYNTIQFRQRITRVTFGAFDHEDVLWLLITDQKREYSGVSGKS